MNRTEISVNQTENTVNRLFRFGLRFTFLSNRRLRLTENRLNRLTYYFGSVHGSNFSGTEKMVNRFSD